MLHSFSAWGLTGMFICMASITDFGCSFVCIEAVFLCGLYDIYSKFSVSGTQFREILGDFDLMSPIAFSQSISLAGRFCRLQQGFALDCGALYVHGCHSVGLAAIIEDGSVQLSPSSIRSCSVTASRFSYKCPIGHLFHHDPEPRREGETHGDVYAL